MQLSSGLFALTEQAQIYTQSTARVLCASSEGQRDSHLDWSEETSIEGTATDNLPVDDARKKQSLLASVESGVCQKPLGEPTSDSLWT